MNKILKQFQETSGRDPWLWPLAPRLAFFAFVAVAVAVLLWFLWLTGYRDELESARAQEATLRTEFSRDYRKAVNLDALKAQREQAIQYVTLLEKQLPSKAEMSALLSDINQAGIGRGLQFELFKPGSVQLKDYYAEQPIEIQVSGSYDEVGQFVSDLAHLPRIVTLGNLQIEKGQKNMADGRLVMKAIAKTYRYLDPEEVAAQSRAKAAARKK
ncbi:type 4a pilus biogenesis protein PilO [Corticibacter populi]|uniref:type 4a pilus biogenesis protein PilO n=1 Tax=Corticibacter populi TaxID=1550736 RepID=UPI001F5ED070|nr:type 4a pilus biogenesis protein PilO [Corticibacter populi]